MDKKLSGKLTIETLMKDLDITPNSEYDGLIIVRKEILKKEDKESSYKLAVQGVGNISKVDIVNIIVGLLERVGIKLPEPSNKEELYVMFKLFDALGEGARDLFQELANRKDEEKDEEKQDEKGGIPNA
jgi:hypothetical protein